MLAEIKQCTIKMGKEEVLHSLKLVGGVTENILPEGKDSASDPQKSGNITLQITGGATWGFACAMKARYKIGQGGGTEITWTVKPEEPLDTDRIAKVARDIAGAQPYVVHFTERGANA